MIALRRARPTDARVLATLRYEFRGNHAPPTETAAGFVRRCAAWMRRALRDSQRWRCWVAISHAPQHSGGAIVGHIWVAILDKVPNPGEEAEHHAYITNLYVQPAARGGVGQKLLATAIDWCEAQGIGSVILWPTDSSRSLYARNGFVVSGEVLDRHLTGPHLNPRPRTRKRARR